MNALEVRDLTKEYKEFRLDHLSLTLPCGCIMGLIGENGAGKSTTIRLVLDMLRRDSGSVKILGQDNQNAGALIREDVGVVLESVGIPECMTAKQTGRVMARCFRNWTEKTYEDLLKQLDVPMDKRFKEFSRGTKMKLGIAIALSHQPKLLLLDEATSGLDPVMRDQVTDLFSEFTRDENHAVLISSHIVTELEKICDYIAFLHKGKLMLCQEKDTLREEYGIFHGTREQFDRLDPAAVVGKRETAYGVEAILNRSAAPKGTDLHPVDIEQLFVFMAKEAS